MAVLDPYNQPIHNLHHMKIPASELAKLCESQEGSVTAKSDNASITIAFSADVHPLDFQTTTVDEGEQKTTTSSVRKEDLAELLGVLCPPG